MEAAFVDIGLPKNGFLYVAEIVLPELDDRERRSKRIQELIQPGQDVLVQVTKDPMGIEGRAPHDGRLARRPLHGAGARRRRRRRLARSSRDAERDRLRDLLKKMKTHEDAGLIARTAAEGASLDELERDVRLLEKLWERQPRPRPARRGARARLRRARPLAADGARRLPRRRRRARDRRRAPVPPHPRLRAAHVARAGRARQALQGQAPALPALRDRAGHPLDALAAACRCPPAARSCSTTARRSRSSTSTPGRFTGTTKQLEDTILKNNLEAAVEVVRQLRLRDIGGIIVVDFIDMASQKNRDAVLEVAAAASSKKDRSKVYVVEISPLGLVEMTRKNVADGVREIMTCECPICEGTGRVLSDESLAIDMLRDLRRVARESKSEAFRVELEDGVARALIGAGGSGLRRARARDGPRVRRRRPHRRAARPLRGPGRGHAATRSAPRRRPARRATSSTLPILEPHRFVETDAVVAARAPATRCRSSAGCRTSARTQRVRIERATRFARAGRAARRRAGAPGRAEAPRRRRRRRRRVADKVSDILEPERRVGERLDVEGRVRRQKRRTAGRAAPRARPLGQQERRRRRWRRRRAAAAKAKAKRRRRGRESADERREREAARRARTARRRPSAAAGAVAAVAAVAAAAAHGARTPGENGAAEAVANGAPAEPVRGRAAAVSDRPPREPGAARPRQQQRRGAAAAAEAARTAPRGRAAAREREPAPAAGGGPRRRAPSRRRGAAAVGTRDAAAASEDERRKGLISRILKR